LGANPGEFTTLPVTELQDLPGTRTLTFAHYANGAGVRSDIVITNASGAMLNARVDFFDDSGNPLSTGIVGAGQGSSLSLTIPSRGSSTISSDGLGPVIAGSVRVTLDRPGGGVVRFGIQGLGIAGVGSSEALERGFLIPVKSDRLSGTDTGIAFVNTGDTPIDIQIVLRNASGGPVRSLSLPKLPVHGHLAKFTRQFFPDLNIDDFEGTLTVTVETSGGKVAGTALEIGAAAGQFTTLPVVQLR
jgi:hypothetical protein